MALTELTKVTGPGIHTLSNILSHNIKSSGIITATKFSGPLDSIGGNFTGVITATNGVFSGNVTIGGTLTYEDVTNIDSVGIITARDGIDCNADLDVDGHTNLDNVSVAGVTTFSGGVTVNNTIDLNGDLDVDGHTNLDNVSIAGVTTSGHLTINGDFSINDNYPSIHLNDTDSNSDFMLQNQNGIFTVYDSTNNADRFEITSSGTVRSQHYEVRSQSPSVSFTDTNHDSDFMIQNANGLLKIYDNTNGADRFAVNSSGSVFVYGNELYIGDSIIHNGDANTKIRFPTNDQIQLETAGSSRLNIDASGNVTVGNNTDTGPTLYVKNANDDANNTNSLALDIQGAWIRLGDAILGNETYSNGIGIKFHNSGTAHHSISAQGQDLYFSTTSSNGNQLWPSSRTDTLRLTGAGSAIFVGDITAGGNLYIPDKIYHVGDTDTYLHFDTNTINLHAGGTTGLTVLDASVRVPTKLGINGAAPQTPLDVIANGSGYAINIRGRSSDNIGELRFTSNNYGSLYGTITGGPTYLKFATGGTNRWQMDSSGHLLPNTAGAVNIGSSSAEIGDVFIADNKKAYFGSDQDFQVSHNGTHAVVKETTGRLYVLSDNLWFKNQADNSTTARFLNGDSVILYYAGNPKLQTVSNGITVTGKVIASEEIEAAQDYPNIQPTLDFNFAATKKLDPRISFYRTKIGSYIDENGDYRWASPNEPKFDHDEVTHESKGLLMEVARTNKLTNGNNIDYGTNSGGSPGPSLVANNVEAPDGSFTARTIDYSNASGNMNSANSEYGWGDSAPAGKTYSASIWVKGTQGQTINMYLDASGQGSGNLNEAKIHRTLTGKWQRMSVYYTYPSGANAAVLRVGTRSLHGLTQGTATVVSLWGTTVVEESRPGSTIATPLADTTTAADYALIDGEAFSEFYSPLEHTTVMIGKRAANVAASDGRLYTISNGTSSQVAPDWDFNDGTHLRLSTNVGGSSQMVQSITSWSGINDEFKIAAGMAVNNQIGVVNGTAIAAADTSCLMPTGVDRLYFGLRGDGGNQGSLTIKRFMFYPKRLPDSQLVTLTS